MPQVIPIIFLALAKAYTVYATLFTALALVSSIAVGFYEADKARRDARDAYNNSLSDRNVTIRSAISARKYVLGMPRTSGTLMYADSVGENKTAFDAVIALACNKCQLVGYYVGDEYIAAADFPGPKYGFSFKTQATETFTVTGTSATVVIAHTPVIAFGNAPSPYRLTATYQGTTTVLQSRSQSGTVTNTVTGTSVHLSGMPTGTKTVKISYYYGATGTKLSAIFKDGDPAQTATSWPGYDTPLWDSTHLLKGVCYVRTLMTWDENLFSSGAPQIGCVLKGGWVDGSPFFDPRDSSNPVYTDNPAILALWWMVLPRNRGGMGIPISWIDLNSVITAANICDELITVKTLDGTGHELIKRYQCHTILSTESAPVDNLEIILNSMAGKRCFTGGQYKIIAGAFIPATLPAITDADVFGDKPITVITAGGDASPANIVTATFVDATKNWIQTSPKPVINSAYIASDGHEEPLEITLPATTDPRQCNYLMGIALESGRPAFSVKMTVTGIGENISIYDSVQLNLVNRAAYSGRTFQVTSLVDNWDGTFDISLSEIKASTWALDGDRFTPSVQGIPADLSFLWNVNPITTIAAVAQTPQKLPDGTTVARIILTWDAITADYVIEGGHIELRYDNLSDAQDQWIGVAPVPADVTRTEVVVASPADTWLRFQARVVNGLGAASDWNYVTVFVSGTDVAPSSGFIARGSCSCSSNTASKSTSGAAAWDSDVYSAASYLSGCAVTFQPKQATAELMVGLNADPAANQTYTSLDFAWYLRGGGTCDIWENGAPALTLVAPYSASTVFSVKYDGQNVQYFMDGVLKRQVALVGATLFMDSSFFTPGASVLNLDFSPLTTAASVPFIARGNCVCTATTAKKLNGTDQWDSDVYSVASYSNGCSLSFQADGNTQQILMAGLNSDPLTDQVNSSIDYAWYLDSAGNLGIYESGIGVSGAFGTYTSSTVLAIKYDGQNLQYLRDSTLVRQVQLVGATLSFDSSFYKVGASIRNITFGPLTTGPAVPFIARGNCIATATTAKKLDGITQWDSDVYTTATYQGGCAVTFQADQTNCQLMVGLNSDPTSDQSYASLDYAWFCVDNGHVQIYESGGRAGDYDNTYTRDTVFTVKYDGQVVSYLIDGVVARQVPKVGATFFMDSSFLQVGSSVRNLQFVPLTTASSVPFLARGSCVCTDTTAKKLGGSALWDSDVYSIQGYSNGCQVTFQPDQANRDFMMGLNADPTTNSSYLTIDYAWRCRSEGTLEIFESGTSAIGSVGSYVTGDVFAIKYDGQQVQYYQNGTLKRQVPVVGATLYMDSSFLDPGGSVRNLYFVPLSTGPEVPFIARGNCSVTADTFSKLSGVDGWDSDIYSTKSYSSGCFLSFRAKQDNSNFMLGINQDPLNNQDYVPIDHAWFCQSNGVLSIYESGSNIGLFGNYSTSTLLSISYDGQVVRYMLNGSVVREVSAINKTFYLDSSFHNVGASAVSVEWLPFSTAPSVPFVARNGCACTNTTARKLPNANPGAWDADVYSFISYRNGCVVSFQPDGDLQGVMVGLNTDPASDADVGSLDYAWYLSGSGNLQIYESGTLAANYGSGQYDGNTIFSITYDGKVVRYQRNGAVLREVLKADQTFYMDSSFAYPNDSIRNLSFSPYGSATTIPWVMRGNCAASATGVIKQGGSLAWDSDCFSVHGYSNCHIQFKASQRFANLMVGLNSDPVTDQSFSSIDFAWYCNANGLAVIYENGVGIVNTGSYTTTTLFAITYDGSSVKYYTDGVLKRTVSASGMLYADSSFQNPGGAINSLSFGPGVDIDKIDTVQIGENAATDLITSSSTNVTVATGTTSIVQLTVSSIYDCAVIITVTGYATYTATAGASGGFVCQVDVSNGVTTVSYLQTSEPVPESSTTRLQIVKRFTYPIAAGSTITATFKAFKSESLHTVSVGQVTIMAEIIKR